MQQIITLAFDIERAGSTDKYDTIAIGASVIDEDLNELDSLFLPAHFPKETVFEDRCWNQFWSKPENLKVLETLEYNGKLSKTARESEIIEEFQNFRRKWERYCQDNHKKLELVCDNNVYDAAFINLLIYDNLDALPIPYTADKQEYSAFWETHAMQRGFLFAVDPAYNSDWNLFKRISELYNIPLPQKQHDHNPANDAYVIAYEHQILQGIKQGKYQRK